MRRALLPLAAALAVAAGGVAADAAAGRAARCRIHTRCARFAKGRAGAAGTPGNPGWSELTPAGAPETGIPGTGIGTGSGTLTRRLAVDEGEYWVRPSRNPVGAGSVQFHVNNFGQDAHDLTITDGTTQFGQVLVASGTSADLTATLPPGNYKLYCSLQGGLHDQWGMHATLSVQ